MTSLRIASSVLSLGLLSLVGSMPAQVQAATYKVTSTNDSGAGTLRQAILNANAAVGTDTIVFSPSTSGVMKISPTSPLPNITEAVIIDGTKMTGYAGKPLVELIGLDAGNAHGLSITSAGSTVKGLSIYSFRASGIASSGGNKIYACYIGLKSNGNVGWLGNGADGIIAGSGDVIGSSEQWMGNLIGGNQLSGIAIRGNGVRIQYNQIGGLNSNGTPRGNKGAGIDNDYESSGNGIVYNTISQNNIGIFMAGKGASGISDNDIFSNLNDGVMIWDSAPGCTVKYNRIFDNGGNGIQITGNDTYAYYNAIAGNGGNGIQVGSISGGVPAVRVRLELNTIEDNVGLGIDLNNDGYGGGTGVNLNDDGDGDGGANGTQNFPELVSATPMGSTTRIVWSLKSKASSTFRIFVYSTDSAHASGYGEASCDVGYSDVTTSSSGYVKFSTDVPPTCGPIWTATATDSSGNTSEFSKAVSVN